jgi:thymidylate synthase
MNGHYFQHSQVEEIRQKLAYLLYDTDYVIDKSGVKVVEIIGATFEANHNTIFGEVNEDYVKRELEWYSHQSLSVNDFPGGAPAIWKQVADSNGMINSNYGWAIWSRDNFSQYYQVLKELQENPNSRRAVMIYTAPDMWYRYNENGRSDFMCTNTVQYFIRHDNIRGLELHAVVQMRSNDAIFGYKNDYAWQAHVQKLLANELKVRVGPMIWHVGSLHVYERHFYLVDHYIQTGKTNVAKSDYRGNW